MSAQYWIGGFFIDLSRNQITQNNQSQTLAPKALAVLTHLAENQGKVVSQDALLTKVWQDTAVSPNTLQKSIAQLRKALGDNGSIYIKTHAKQGYSLECDVRWQDNIQSASAEETDVHNTSNDNLGLSLQATQPEPQRSTLKLASIITGLIIGVIIAYQSLAPEQTSQLTFDGLRMLTATDDKEFDASYTPDGKYIVFHRYLDKQCVNKIWAKDIATQKEIQLTKDWGAYGRHSFSKDGKQMIFLSMEACNKPTIQKDCYDLVSLDFEEALQSPKQPRVMLQCKSTIIKKPIWYHDDKIVLKQKHSDRWKLISYSISDNKSSDLYELSEGNLIDFAYSEKRNLIAVIRIQADEQYYIDMLRPDGRIVSSHPIERPLEIPKFRPLYPNFAPSQDQLIFSTGRQLFTLSFEGKIGKISSPFSESMQQPEFHPDGKKLLMIKGPYDSDIVKLGLNQLSEVTDLIQSNQPQANQSESAQTEHQQTNLAETYTSLERTNVGESDAIFQPKGETIAFWSERSGESQIWITDENGPKQISHFPMDSYIRGFDWAADGQSLLVNADGVLTQVHLDASQKSFTLQYPVIRLYQWDSENNSTLLLIRINGINKFVEYNLDSSEMLEPTDKFVIWAQKTDDGRLIYKDHLDQFWQPGAVEDQKITQLDKLGNKSKSFVLNNNVIYAINKENKLWSYDLNSESLKILGDVDKSVDYLTDVDQSHILMSIQVAAKKEVVELSISE